MENIDGFFSADDSTEEGNEEAMMRIEAVMLMFDDLLSNFGHGIEGIDPTLRSTNHFYKQMTVTN